MTTSEDTTWNLYLALWHRAEKAGVGVHYIGFCVQGEAGFFDPHDEPNSRRRPELAMVRPYYASDDPLGHKPPRAGGGHRVQVGWSPFGPNSDDALALLRDRRRKKRTGSNR